MNEPFPAPGQRTDQRIGRAGMVGVGRVDDRIGPSRIPVDELRIVERTDDGVDPELPQGGTFRVTARQSDDLVASTSQRDGDGPTDVAGRAGDEDDHWSMVVAAGTAAKGSVFPGRC